MCSALKNPVWTPEVLDRFHSLPSFVMGGTAAVEAAMSTGSGGRGRVFLHDIDAGHWLHVENFPGLINLMAPALRRQ